MLRITSIVLACLFFALPAQARTQHHGCVEVDIIRPVCGMIQPFSGAASIRVTMRREKAVRPRIIIKRITPAPMIHVAITASTTIVGHPAGCPSRAFCGCGAAVRVFGHAVRELWLAANWYKFPRSTPAPGMVAVRRHHVFVLEADLGGGMWQVYDANSGGHATRIHARSISGYTIVNPRA